jgi:hypothetical protein
MVPSVIFLTENALAVFTLWLAWEAAEIWLVAKPWMWYLLLAVAGLVIEWRLDHRWWLGIGLAGAAVLLKKISDLILVATDAAKVMVLRNSQR